MKRRFPRNRLPFSTANKLLGKLRDSLKGKKDKQGSTRSEFRRALGDGCEQSTGRQGFFRTQDKGARVCFFIEMLSFVASSVMRKSVFLRLS